MIHTKTPIIMNEGALQCPRCGGDNLHQEAANVLFRYSEDSILGTRVYADLDGAVEASSNHEQSHNPSLRRDGMTVHFSCETCHSPRSLQDIELLTLCIVQHKGLTLMYWDGIEGEK